MTLSSVSLPQPSLAAAISLCFLGAWAGTTPPNASPDKQPATGDSIRRIIDAQKQYSLLIYLPVGLQTLHYVGLVLTHPDVPPALLRHGAENGLDPGFLTWSRQTAIPIALLLGVGAPLRLASYAGLGKNFTFALAEPDGLNTGGLYRYMQHPSYTGAVALGLGLWGLLYRSRGHLSCLIPPKVFPYFQIFEKISLPLMVVLFAVVFRNRVMDEEKMLKAKFGKEWEAWHARTARFIPFIF